MNNNTESKKFNNLITDIFTDWNEEQFIGKCIRSLLTETFQREKFNIIEVNDVSTDPTSSVLELFKKDIVFGIPKEKINIVEVKKATKKVEKKAQISKLIESWKNEYKIIVGGQFVMLSGEHQQIRFIARALYKNIYWCYV
jgi:cellulose synthase/poly-beta-1,6-N-acetylglucosamine synthase-like glycosyltransferase